MPTNLTSSIELIFRGTNLIGTAATSALRDVDRFNRGVQSSVAPVALLTAGILALEASAARMAVAFGGSVIDSTLEYGRAQNELTKVLRDGSPPIDNFRGRIVELSNDYGQLSPVVIRAAADFVKAGADIGASFDFVEVALDGAIAGEIELTEVAVKLRSALAGFSISAGDTNTALSATREILDLVNASSNRFNVDFDELLDAFVRFSPVASQANLSFKETVAAATAVTEVFQKGEISGRALSAITQRLVGDNAKVAAGLKDLGVSQTDANGKLRQGTDIFFDMAIALANVEGSERAATAARIAGIDQAPKLLAVAGSLNKVLEIQAAGFDAAGSAAKEADIVLKGTAIEFERNAAAADNFRIALGTKFDPAIKGITAGFGDILRALEELTRGGSLDGFINEVTPTLNEIQRLADEIAKALPEALEQADFSGFSGGIKALLGDLENVSVTGDNLADFITSVGNGFEDLAKFTSGVIDVFRSVAAVVGPVISAYGDLDETTQNLLTGLGAGALVISVFGGAITGLVTVATAAAGAFTGLTAAALAFNTAGGAGPAILATLTRSATTLAGALGAAAGAAGVGLLTFELGKLANANDLIVPDWLAGYENASFGSIIADIADVIRGTNSQIESTGRLNEALAETKRVASNSVFGGFQTDLLKVQSETSKTISGLSEMNAVIAANDATAPRVFLELQELDDVDIVPKLGRVGSAIKKLGKDTKAGTEAANKGLDEFSVKALEIASNERIALIKSKVELDIAGLQADARIVEATFKSLDTTISSTGSLLGNLFGLLPQLDRFDQLAVLQQIEREDRRREKALELQTKLVEAQIDKMEAQTRQIRKGKALIQVDASPLKPHLQNILHEILAQIQLEASGDLTELLLNINPGLTLPTASAVG